MAAVIPRHVLLAALLASSFLVVRTFQPPPCVGRRLASDVLQSPIGTHPSDVHPSPTATRLLAASSKSTDAAKKGGRRPKGKRWRSNKSPGKVKNPKELETWRIYGIDVAPDALGSSATLDRRKVREADPSPERSYMTKPVLEALLSRLRIKSANDAESDTSIENDAGGDAESDTSIENDAGGEIALPPELSDAVVVRRSLDARRRRGADPKYTYVIDATLTRENAARLGLTHKPGRIERMNSKIQRNDDDTATAGETEESGSKSTKPKIIIVGAGPAGLFCALSLASSGQFTPILLERGQPVEARGKSIGALIHRRSLDPESNFSFGEGGAGTWSDGKLTTRIGRNSEAVRFVLETLVKYGAPSRILVEGAPHLGTDNLVRLLRNMREDLKAMGGEIHFGTCANKFRIEEGCIKGVDATATAPTKKKDGKTDPAAPKKSTETYDGDAVVLATGHSARDVYYELHDAGVELEAKGFAVGFRIEHPQSTINEIQYGRDWGGRVFTQRHSTDAANIDHFANDVDEHAPHTGTLPVASYRLATNEAFDGETNRGAYSFCQCPGGQIVPSSTEEEMLCINGMSFSNRDSVWANAALVVTVSPDDPILDKYRSTHGNLAGLEFQKEMESRAYELGGGGMVAPVQRLTDYLDRRVSESVPSSSYRLGVKSAALHDIYPQPLYNALADAAVHHFDKQMPGFVCEEALLHGVETRTSSPVRVARDPDTFQAKGVDNLFPSGEGAGFAGGIVSAAVDGLMVANAVMAQFHADETSSQLFKDGGSSVAIGYEY